MAAEVVTDRLGVEDYGSDGVIGNVLLYPRRIVLAVLRQLLSQEDLFTPIDAAGSAEQRNPFILRMTDAGNIAADSRIVLADFASEKLLKEEARPRVIVERGSGAFSGTGFSQKNFTAWAGSNSGQRFSDIYNTSLIIRCVGRKKFESEELALVVSMGLWFFHQDIKRSSNLFHLSPPHIGQTMPEKFDAEVEQYVTQITMDVQQTINWQKTQIDPKVLADVCVNLTVSL